MSECALPIRCTCAKAPLLAMCGRDEATGEPWVHIKSWKQNRIFVEVVVLSGTVKIHCRECMRWYKVRIIRGAPAELEMQRRSPLLDL